MIRIRAIYRDEANDARAVAWVEEADILTEEEADILTEDM
jgi:hypothetical protein